MKGIALVAIAGWGLVACCAAALAAESAPPAGPAPAAERHKADWLYKARWGVMAHFTKTFLES